MTFQKANVRQLLPNFWLLIKIIVITAACAVIYSTVQKNEQLVLADFYHFLTKIDRFSMVLALFIPILTFFNWFFEILKWRNLSTSFQSISTGKAAVQSLASHTVAFITPHRVGEFGAKAMYYPKSLRPQVLTATAMGNLAQLCATLFIGLVGVIAFISTYTLPELRSIASPVFGTSILIALVLIWAAKTSLHGFSLERLKVRIVAIPREILIRTFGYALMRYMMFSVQFYLLLRVFGANLGFVEGMALIATTYLVASMLPVLNVFDVVVKGSVAVFVFGFAGIDGLLLIYVTTLMWLLNVVLPCLPGSWFVIRFKQRSSLTAIPISE